jgi:hypothetical protein
MRGGVRRRQTRPLTVVAALLLAAVASGCAKGRAAEAVVGPPLAVPAPPARVVTPAEPVPLAAAPGRTETPLSPAPGIVKPEPPPRAAAPATGAATKPGPVAAATPSSPPVEPFRDVRIDPSAREVELRSETEMLLASVASTLNRVTRQNLSALHRQQYDDSKSLSEIAQKALAERNFLFALTNARKAAQLAAALGSQ